MDEIERQGCEQQVVDDLRIGINGVLERELNAASGLRCVERNTNRSPDFVVMDQASRRAAIESKLFYDLTFSKYLASIVEDRQKLLAWKRIHGSETDTAFVVFFVQLPSVNWPATRWYGSARASQSRQRQTVWGGISQQYAELRRRLDQEPIWPGTAPQRFSLIEPANPVTLDIAKRWIDAVAAPTIPWDFSPAQHLRDAAVGIAIWAW